MEKFIRIPEAASRKIVYDEHVADLLTVATPPTTGVMQFKPRMFTIAASSDLSRGAESTELPALTPDHPVRVVGGALEALDARNSQQTFTLPEGVTADATIAGIRDVTFRSGTYSVTGSVVADLN